MPFITSNGTRIHWDQSGKGTPILLIMGHRYSSAMWYPLKEAIGDRYHLIWFDNQGTGESEPRDRTSVSEMTSDALAVLNAAGVETAHVYGVSMGGGLALEFGARYSDRVRSLILGCTMAKTPDVPNRPEWLIKLIYNLPMPILKALASKKFKGGYGDAAPDDRIARDRAMAEQDPFVLKGVMAQGLAISKYSITPEEVGSIRPPAIVLHGNQDLTVPYEAGVKLSQMLPAARLVTLDAAGHNYFIAEGEKATIEVDRFIAEVEQAR